MGRHEPGRRHRAVLVMALVLGALAAAPACSRSKKTAADRLSDIIARENKLIEKYAALKKRQQEIGEKLKAYDAKLAALHRRRLEQEERLSRPTPAMRNPAND